MNTPLSWWRERPKKEPREKAKWTDIAIVVLTLAIVYLAYETGGQTDQLIKAANIQAGAATKSAQAAADFSTYASGINEHTSNAVDQFRRLADESKESIRATQDVMRQDERAWVGLAHIDELQPFDEKPEHYPKFRFRFVNSGKTPATDVRTWIDWQSSIDMGPKCDGPRPLWFGAQSIPPEGEFILREPTDNPWYIEDAPHLYWEKNHGNGYFCVYGEVSYTDVFFGEARRHVTRFCIYAQPNKPEKFRYCPKFNDMN